MNYIRQKLHQKFAFLSELSIRAKIQLLVISSILVLSIISLGGTQMIIRKYNETLYQSVETSLSYSTKEISSYLDTIDNMADQILANKTLQESLASWSDASASLNSSTYFRKTVFSPPTISSRIPKRYTAPIWYLWKLRLLC